MNWLVTFQGGVHLTKEPGAVPNLVTSMLGNRLITKQTPADGIPVSKVRAVKITFEFGGLFLISLGLVCCQLLCPPRRPSAMKVPL